MIVRPTALLQSPRTAPGARRVHRAHRVLAVRAVRAVHAVLAVAASLSLCGCTHWFFSGIPQPRRDLPVCRIETRGGVEFGATTQEGILFLGRTARVGPCRIHYFLGDQLVVEDGTIEPTTGVYCRAAMDLKHHNAPLWTERVGPADRLVALELRGESVSEWSVRVARDDVASGDVLEHPGRSLPAGTPIFRRSPEDDSLAFVGLVAGEASIERRGAAAATARYVVFTGMDRLTELLLEPQPHPALTRAKFRPDGIHVREPIELKK